MRNSLNKLRDYQRSSLGTSPANDNPNFQGFRICPNQMHMYEQAN